MRSRGATVDRIDSPGIGDTVAVSIRAAHHAFEAGYIGAFVFAIGNAVIVAVGATFEGCQAEHIGAFVFSVGHAVFVAIRWSGFAEVGREADAMLPTRTVFDGETVLALHVDAEIRRHHEVEAYTGRDIEIAASFVEVVGSTEAEVQRRAEETAVFEQVFLQQHVEVGEHFPAVALGAVGRTVEQAYFNRYDQPGMAIEAAVVADFDTAWNGVTENFTPVVPGRVRVFIIVPKGTHRHAVERLREGILLREQQHSGETKSSK